MFSNLIFRLLGRKPVVVWKCLKSPQSNWVNSAVRLTIIFTQQLSNLVKDAGFPLRLFCAPNLVKDNLGGKINWNGHGSRRHEETPNV